MTRVQHLFSGSRKRFYDNAHLRGMKDKRIGIKLVTPVLVCLLWSTGCNSNSTVANFAASAQAAVSAGDPIFADFAGTCGREVANRQAFGGF